MERATLPPLKLGEVNVVDKNTINYFFSVDKTLFMGHINSVIKTLISQTGGNQHGTGKKHYRKRDE